MSDVSSVPGVQERLAAIRAETAEAADKAAAAAQVESDRCAALDAAKARCAAECGEVTAALDTVTDQRERQAIIDLEAEVHASHAPLLEEAYLAFSGQRQEESNPAGPGAETLLTADVAVTSETAVTGE